MKKRQSMPMEGYKSRAVKAKKYRPNRRRMAERRSLSPHAAKKILIGLGASLAGIIVASALGWGVWWSWQALLVSPRFALHTVQIQGQHRLSLTTLQQEAGLRLGESMLQIDVDAVAKRLEKQKWIEKVSVRRLWPDVLKIEVQEYKPALLANISGILYVVDVCGRPFKVFSPADKLILPVVTGFSKENIKENIQAVTLRLQKAISLAQLVQEQKDILGKLDEVHWDERLGWKFLVSRPSILQIHMGHDPLSQFERVLATVQRLDENHQIAEVIWAGAEKNPEKVQVQLVKQDAANTPLLMKSLDSSSVVSSPSQKGMGLMSPDGRL